MNKFSVVLSNGKEIKGIEFKASNPRANLLIITGMDEHSSRYKDFALRLNDENISVSILDHFGQGENISDISEIEKVPRGSWDMEIEGLKLKIDELKRNNLPVFLMGHSMGSFSTQCFIQRYPKAKFHITGFKYEPWHYRYVGIKVAKIIHNKNITLEEYKKKD